MSFICDSVKYESIKLGSECSIYKAVWNIELGTLLGANGVDWEIL